MKKLLIATISAAVLTTGSTALALIASDSAGNYSGAWTNGANGGTGFGAWDVFGDSGTGGGGFNGFGIGTAAAQFSNYSPLYSANGAFYLFAGGAANNDADQNAARPFSSLMAIGDVFTHSIAFSFDNGFKGFDLYNSTSSLAPADAVFNFNIGSSYSWSGGGSAAMTPWEPNRTNGVIINFSFTRTSTGFNYAFSSSQDANLTQNGSIAASGLGGIKYYVGNAGGGDGGNLYFNNLSVVPEPSTYALLALSAAGLAGYAARRRARK